MGATVTALHTEPCAASTEVVGSLSRRDGCTGGCAASAARRVTSFLNLAVEGGAVCAHARCAGASPRRWTCTGPWRCRCASRTAKALPRPVWRRAAKVRQAGALAAAAITGDDPDAAHLDEVSEADGELGRPSQGVHLVGRDVVAEGVASAKPGAGHERGRGGARRRGRARHPRAAGGARRRDGLVRGQQARVAVPRRGAGERVHDLRELLALHPAVPAPELDAPGFADGDEHAHRCRASARRAKSQPGSLYGSRRSECRAGEVGRRRGCAFMMRPCQARACHQPPEDPDTGDDAASRRRHRLNRCGSSPSRIAKAVSARSDRSSGLLRRPTTAR